MTADPIRFDDLSRCSLSDQPLPPGGVLRAVRDAAESAGLDPISELYNEALRFANNGQLRLARERLRILLGFTPGDAEAHLLLGKVHVAGQQWKEALGSLDSAAQAGADVPDALRTAIEGHLRDDEESRPEVTEARRVREEGEVKSLRQEVRRLRSENAHLSSESDILNRQARNWAWVAAGVSVFVMLVVLMVTLTSDSATPEIEATPVVTTESDDAAPEFAPAPEATPSASNSDLANRVGEVIQNNSMLEGIESYEVDDEHIILTGSVLTSEHRKQTHALILAVPGIQTVDTEGLTILARTVGTTHVVRSGDTLGDIAQHYYGDGTLYQSILDGNEEQLGNRHDLSVGQELAIPAID